MDTRGATRLLPAAALAFASACSSSSPPPRRAVQAKESRASDPAAVASLISGDWQFAIERGGRSIEGWLHFGFTAGQLVGSLTGEDATPREISKIALKGEKISWQIAGESRTERYEGTLKGSSMEGSMKFGPGTAGREGGGESGRAGRSGGAPGGGYGGRHGGGGRGGPRGESGEIRWKAYRSVLVTPVPPPAPTAAPR